MEPERVRYDSAWNRLRRYTRTCTALLVALLVLFACLAFLGAGPAAVLLVAFTWITVFAVASAMLLGVGCPRCGESFVCDMYSRKRQWPFSLLLRDKCEHCGLPKNALPPPQPDADT